MRNIFQVAQRSVFSFLFCMIVTHATVVSNVHAAVFSYGEVEVEADEKSMSLWGTTFSALPGPLNDVEVLKLLGPSPECPGVVTIAKQLQQYRELLMSSQSQLAVVQKYSQGFVDEIRVIMTKNHEKSCRDALVNTYIAGSVYLLTQSWRVIGSPKIDGLHFIPEAAGWTYLTIAALRKGMIKLKTPVLTQASSLKNSSGKKDKASVLGTYDCDKAVIEIDPMQPPLNLAATLIHEYTHFFIDKYSSFNNLEFKKENFREFLILEEAIAALHSGHLQREFADQVLAKQLDPKKIGDLSFFSTSGPMVKIGDQVSRLSGTVNSYTFESLVTATFFIKDNIYIEEDDSNVPMIKGGSRAIEQFRNELFSRISLSYFGRTLQTKELHKLAPKSLNLIFSGKELGGGFELAISPDLFFTNYARVLRPIRWTAEIGELKRNITDIGIFKITQSNKSMYYDMEPVMQMILALGLEPVKNKGQLCQIFEDATTSGSLNDYVGVSNINRPGVDGVRPGVDGVRPEMSNTKPSSSSVRTCVLIGDQL
jgi:hypothetical protein